MVRYSYSLLFVCVLTLLHGKSVHAAEQFIQRALRNQTFMGQQAINYGAFLDERIDYMEGVLQRNPHDPYAQKLKLTIWEVKVERSKYVKELGHEEVQ